MRRRVGGRRQAPLGALGVGGAGDEGVDRVEVALALGLLALHVHGAGLTGLLDALIALVICFGVGLVLLGLWLSAVASALAEASRSGIEARTSVRPQRLDQLLDARERARLAARALATMGLLAGVLLLTSNLDLTKGILAVLLGIVAVVVAAEDSATTTAGKSNRPRAGATCLEPVFDPPAGCPSAREYFQQLRFRPGLFFCRPPHRRPARP